MNISYIKEIVSKSIRSLDENETQILIDFVKNHFWSINLGHKVTNDAKSLVEYIKLNLKQIYLTGFNLAFDDISLLSDELYDLPDQKSQEQLLAESIFNEDPLSDWYSEERDYAPNYNRYNPIITPISF